MNRCSSRVFVGGAMLLIASIFLNIGWIPAQVIQYPRYSSSSRAKKDLRVLTLSPASFIRWKTTSKWCKWSCESDFVVSKRSSIYVRTYLRSSINDDIFSWKISGLFDNPIGSFWYSYLAHGSTIVHRRLESGLLLIKVGAAHSERFTFFRTPILYVISSVSRDHPT